MKYLVTCKVGNEFIVKSLLEEKVSNIEIQCRPFGFHGILIVEDKENRNLEEIFEEIPEIEKYFEIQEEINFEDENHLISFVIEKFGKSLEGKRFYVKVFKRGLYNWSRMKIESEIAKAISEKYNAKISFDDAEKVLTIHTLPKNIAFLSLVDASKFFKKFAKKKDSLKFFKKVKVGQLFYYSDDEKIVRKFGEILGRSAQNFEIKELVFLIDSPTDARLLWKFLREADKGAYSRYLIQKKAYSREVEKVKITLYDVYQFIRSINRKKSLVIITDPRGKTIEEVKEKLKKDLKFFDEIIILNGSSHGIPPGCFKFAHYILDLSPKIVYSTDFAISNALITLLQLYLED